MTHTLLDLPIDESILGLINGSAMTASLVAVTKSRRQSLLAVILVILFGCGLLLAWEGTPNRDRMFILAFLVTLCRLGASVTKRFMIADLMVLTTAVAMGLFFVQRTGLIDRDALYWTGTMIFAITIALAVSSRGQGGRLYIAGLFLVASLATFGFAAADAHWVQPDRLDFQTAMIRYAALMFGMITPPIVYRLCSHFVASKSKIHELAPAPHGHAFAGPISNDDSRGTSVMATEAIESTWRVVAAPSALRRTTR
ncbi:hypothetical protein [Neorhodopirellula pilleata]|uniref:Uncharacterized protein n=1 Tax=Neorhodopirellula pilleata TaxID=2714738 RepID=A0A5C5ZG32_9BACT|nr:hypothetical protein [Neorhodopirellula pilleata]TWT86098.1 hypothetical protein Pla100_61920 [Neorhodopirellula pilleata]